MRTLLTLIVAAVFILGTSSQSLAEPKEMTIGTASATGVYYPVGGAIAKTIEMKTPQAGLKLVVLATDGSVDNIQRLLDDKIDFGFVQGDLLYHALLGRGPWKETGPQDYLRTVFDLYPEIVTLVARADAEIKTITDLAGKKVNTGEPGSIIHHDIKKTLAAFELADKIQESQYAPVEALRNFKKGEIDAFFFIAGHPNNLVMEAAFGEPQAVIVPIDGPIVDKAVSEKLYLTKEMISLAYYPNLANSAEGKIPSFAIKAHLVCRADESEQDIYNLVKGVFDNFEFFKSLHPALAELTKESMLDGITAPLHPGALKYYQEVGLVK